MEKWIPRVGDGCVHLKTGKQYVVRTIFTVGSQADKSPDPNDRPNDIIGVGVSSHGVDMRLDLKSIRQETFGEFLSRPTGFGKTPWILAAIIGVALLFGNIVCIATWKDMGWIGTIILLIVKGVIMWSTWKNYRNYR